MDNYRDEILEHWREPQNFGKMKGADKVVREVNTLCGDEVTFYFKIKEGKILGVSFTGQGCAISTACASLVSEAIKGKSVSSAIRFKGEDVFDLLGGAVSPARLKCAFLALEAIKKLKAKN
jgi:nitrogen fixation NifU-like protein